MIDDGRSLPIFNRNAAFELAPIRHFAIPHHEPTSACRLESWLESRLESWLESLWQKRNLTIPRKRIRLVPRLRPVRLGAVRLVVIPLVVIPLVVAGTG